MRSQALANEAIQCRKLALHYSGQPEERLLLNVAAAFDALAREAKNGHRPN